MSVDSAGIIAAGEGSRFKKAGIHTHKPLVPVAGFPLIGHTLRRLERCGVKKVTIIFNELEGECVDWVRQNFPSLSFQFIVKSTESSFESFWLVGQALGPGRHLLSTVDSICSTGELQKMLAPGAPDSPEIYLGVTGFVHDEKPLWVRADASRRITALNTPSGDYATAGFYNAPGSIFKARPEKKIASLRVFLGELLHQGLPVYAIPLADVVDVDTPEDLEMAEQLMSKEK